MISCISDEDDFANDVYKFLLSELEKQKQFKESRDIMISSELIKFDPAENEIHVNGSTRVPLGMIKWILQSYLERKKMASKDYDVVEFGGQLTIGRILDPSKMELHICEICGFFTPYSEEIHTHRMTHFGI